MKINRPRIPHEYETLLAPHSRACPSARYFRYQPPVGGTMKRIMFTMLVVTLASMACTKKTDTSGSPDFSNLSLPSLHTNAENFASSYQILQWLDNKLTQWILYNGPRVYNGPNTESGMPGITPVAATAQAP